MANMHLVTGFAGYEHVTSADQGLLNSYIFGDLEVVMERGNMFEASIISNNIIRVKDGDLLMQGRFARLNDDSYVELAIDNGTQGYFRNDLIVARYQKDVVTAVETMDLVVIKGENAESDPVDPAHVKGDIKFGKDFQNDIPLWRVSLDGLNVTGLTCLFSTFGSTLSKLKNHADTHAVGGSDPLTLERLGIGDYTHPASKVSITEELAEAVGSDPSAEDALEALNTAVRKSMTSDAYMWEYGKASYLKTFLTAFTANAALFDLQAISIYYADSVEVVSATEVKMVNPSVIAVRTAYTTENVENIQKVLVGKYVTGESHYNASTGIGSLIYYIPEDASISVPQEFLNGAEVCGTLTCTKRHTVAIQNVPAEVYGAIFDSDINAYPQEGEVEGLHYKLRGQLGEAMAYFAKVQIGSYVGTGAYGASNANSLTFDFEPKSVFIATTAWTGSNGPAVFVNPTTSATDGSSGLIWSGNSVYWYAWSAATQMNQSGSTYIWIAIG